MFPYNVNPMNIIALKPSSSITNDVRGAMDLLAINKDKIRPFGSWIYKSQLYPGDIDLLEAAYHCCSPSEAAKVFAKKLQKIVKNIMNTRYTYVGDIKAGMDKRYIIDMGNIDYGARNIIEGYDYKNVRNQLRKLRNNKLLTSSEYETMKNLAIQDISIENFEKLYNLLRQKWLLRWSEDDILNGYKTLTGNVKYFLDSAIQDHTMTKIDVLKYINNKFVEVTNAYMLYYTDKEGNHVLLNFRNDLNRLAELLRLDANKLIYSPTNFNPFKAIKRLWSMNRINRNFDNINIITPFMQTDIGRLAQIKSEIETLILILISRKSPPIKTILKQINNFKTRLANIYQVDFDEKYIDSIIDSIETLDVKEIVVKLNEIMKYIKEIMNKYSLEFLENNPRLLDPF